MRLITKDEVNTTLVHALEELAFELPEDVLAGLHSAYQSALIDSRERDVLLMLLDNAAIAREKRVPLCQDTGSVWVCLEIGPDCSIAGDVFEGVNECVRHVYVDQKLRKSIVQDAFVNRENTQDNTPAFCEIALSQKPGARLYVMAKGGGSDNASRVVMLAPGAGKQGIKDAVLECVQQKAANACPPLIVGIGIGATFDKVASLAKHALMRPLGAKSQDETVAQFESELLASINDLGIGAGALGGQTTALAVNIETAPCHIAALPIAINMGCSALRRGTYEL